MPLFRRSLPQLAGDLYLTDGGIETTLIFLDGLELPQFASFPLLATAEGQAILRKYFRTYVAIAARHGTGLILESATWRASAGWGARLGFSPEALAQVNREAIRMLEDIRSESTSARPVVISGCVGPRGDGYVVAETMSEQEAEAYHGGQIDTFAGTDADMVCALTMNYVEEALGIARAARKAAMPVAISFTVETDGALPTGQSLEAAIQQVDDATSGYPCYYMINCAHPTHFEHVLEGGSRLDRIRGIRANASPKSHAELNDSTELDIGDPAEFGQQYARARQRLPRLNVMGGCCGTDHRHLEAIAATCAPLFPHLA